MDTINPVAVQIVASPMDQHAHVQPAAKHTIRLVPALLAQAKHTVLHADVETVKCKSSRDFATFNRAQDVDYRDLKSKDML